jgi:hypothetical protein
MVVEGERVAVKITPWTSKRYLRLKMRIEGGMRRGLMML